MGEKVKAALDKIFNKDKKDGSDKKSPLSEKTVVGWEML